MFNHYDISGYGGGFIGFSGFYDHHGGCRGRNLFFINWIKSQIRYGGTTLSVVVKVV